MENLLGKMQEVMSDKETMQQISELAQMLKTSDNSETKNQNQNSSPPAKNFDNSNNLDANILMQAQELLQQNSEPDKNTALLLALRPHLCEQRQLKIDKAVKLLHLWNIWKNLKETGMLQNLLS